MAEQTIWGVDSTFLHSVMALLWVLLLVVLFYRRNELSQKKFYGLLGLDLVWLVYSLFNLNYVVLTTVPVVLTLGIDVILGITFLAGCYISIKALSADAE